MTVFFQASSACNTEYSGLDKYHSCDAAAVAYMLQVLSRLASFVLMVTVVKSIDI